MLGGGIVHQRVVTIQVIRRDIEDGSDVRMEIHDCFQLKTRDFNHRPAIIARRVNHGNQCRTYVSTYLDVHPSVSQHLSDQSGRCCFTVRSGNSDNASAQKSRCQLNFADDFRAAPIGIADRNGFPRYAGADDD